MANRIQTRRDTAANWTSANPVLANGERGLETDTKRHKVGDGTTAWTTLAYQHDKAAADILYSPLTVGGKIALRKDELVFNVKDYGAVGDGVVDDTAAIQTALTALTANGTLFFPVGNYIVSSALTVPSYVTFMGTGKSSRITFTSTSGTMITLTNQREVKWDHLYFVSTGTSSTLFNLSNTFRCEWRECYLNGQFVGPANTGSYLNQTAIVLTDNSGDNNIVNCDITNYGIGLKTDCIQNGVIGGKFGTNNVSISGFGGGGMSITGYVDFVGAPANVSTHVVAAGSGQWWFANVWMEGCSKAIQVGSNTPSVVTPSQFGMVNCKLAATTTIIDIQSARNPHFFNIQLTGDSAGVATPTPVVLDATNAAEGVMFADSLVTGLPISPSAFPIGWMVHTRGGATATLKAPTFLDLSYGSSLRLARSDNVFTPILQMSGGPTVLFRTPSSSGVAESLKIQDNAGAPIFYYDAVASSANYLAVKPSVAGSTPELDARGTDTNIALKLVPKGTGTIQAATDFEVTTSASGVILKSPNGTRFRLGVDDSGALTTTSL